MELSWRFGLYDFAMPYFIQITKELTQRVETVQKKHEDREKKEEKQAQQQMSQPLDVVSDFLLPGAFTAPMLMAGPMTQSFNSNPNVPNMGPGFMGMGMGGMGMGMGMGGYQSM